MGEGRLSCRHLPNPPGPSRAEAEHPRSNKARGFPDGGVQPGSWDTFGLRCLLPSSPGCSIPGDIPWSLPCHPPYAPWGPGFL